LGLTEEEKKRGEIEEKEWILRRDSVRQVAKTEAQRLLNNIHCTSEWEGGGKFRNGGRKNTGKYTGSILQKRDRGTSKPGNQTDHRNCLAGKEKKFNLLGRDGGRRRNMKTRGSGDGEPSNVIKVKVEGEIGFSDQKKDIKEAQKNQTRKKRKGRKRSLRKEKIGENNGKRAVKRDLRERGGEVIVN